jgi:hypothetical protein
MVRNGPTKRQRGDISAKVGVGVCMLLPPLLMAAVLVFFDSFPPQGDGPEGAAQQARGAESIVAKTVSLAGRSDAGARFLLASAEQRLLTNQRATSEQPSVAEPSAPDRVTERRTATEERPVGGLLPLTKDPAPYYGPITVSLVHVGKGSEPPVMADLEASMATAGSSKISRQLPAATRSYTSHASVRVGRLQPTVHRVHRQRSQSLGQSVHRPSIARHTRRS